MVLTPRLGRSKGEETERLEMSWKGETGTEGAEAKGVSPRRPLVSAVANLSTADAALRAFAQAELKERRCAAYVVVRPADRRPGRPEDLCYCGRVEHWHREASVPLHPDPTLKWRSGEQTALLPTSAFGRVEFTGYGTGGGRDAAASFVRVHHLTPPETLCRLLLEELGLTPAKLLISVTGGAKALQMKPRLEAAFKQGLMDVAATTHAWLITGGTATGVMRVVGEAIAEQRASGLSTQGEMVALGIAPWGCVDNAEALSGPEGRFPAEYNLRACSGVGAPLDHNHTHFILVDDGTQGKYGTEISLRAGLESHIASTKTEAGLETPIVLIVCEGGPNTVQQTWEAVEKGVPAVLVKGSGRAADLIAAAFKATRPKRAEDEASCFPAAFDEHFAVDIARHFDLCLTEDSDKRKISRTLELLRGILGHRGLLTVFELSDAACRDMDKAVLSALLKAKSWNPQSQVDLALVWGRADVARAQIFSLDNRARWKGLALEETMEAALSAGSTDFAQLCLDHGVSLAAFLTVRRLRNLYRTALRRDTHIALILNHLLSKTKVYDRMCNFGCGVGRIEPNRRDDFLLLRMGSVVRYLLNDNFAPKYASEEFVIGDEGDPGPPLDEPYNDLFLWAILTGEASLGRMFWRWMRNPIGGALVAARLLQSLAEEAECQEEVELAQELSTQAKDYETTACEVLSQCYALGKSASHLLLRREQRSWGGTTLLSLAESAHLMDFMQLSPCQTMLNRLWYGGLADYTQDWKIVLVILCPPLVPLLRFKARLEDTAKEVLGLSLAGEGARPTPMTPSEAAQVVKAAEKTAPPKRKFKVGWCGLGPGSLLSAWWRFYTSPVTTFYVGTLFYAVFLGLISVVSLTRLEDVDKWTWSVKMELVVWVWTFTMWTEEVRSILTREAKSVGFKLRNHFAQFWNQLQALFTILIAVTMGLRLKGEPESLETARVLYALAVLLAYLRFMESFYVSKLLGPKIIMIQKMLRDLGLFVAVLMVFVASFGIAMQSLLHPHEEFSLNSVKGAFYVPYWRIFGELFLEDSEGKVEDEGSCRVATNATALYSEQANKATTKNAHLPLCPQKTFLVPLLQAVYMMLTNVLLLNLLIAMFSYTFQSVQDKSEKVWRFYRYTVVRKYFHAPSLPPPLVFIPHLKRLFHFCFTYARSSRLDLSNPFKLRLGAEEEARLVAFEKAGRERHLASTSLRSSERLEAKVSLTKARIDAVAEELEDIREQLLVDTGGGDHTTEASRETLLGGGEPSSRLNLIQEKLDRHSQLLRDLIRTLRESSGGS